MNEEGSIGEDQPGKETGQQQWSQQPSQQGYQQGQPPSQVSPPRENFLKRMTTNDGLAKMLALGFVLILIGMLIIHAAPFATNWGGDQYDEDVPDMTEEEMADDEATQNALEYTGNLIRDLGIFFIGFFLVLGGIHRDDLDTKYRMLMISLAIIFILVAWFGFFTSIPVAPV
ncbi:MAG: hypothetical protein ACOC8Y_02110 [Candidatus Natronoplasma sp.]